MLICGFAKLCLVLATWNAECGVRSKLVHKTCPWSVATLLSSELCTRIVAAKVRREPQGSAGTAIQTWTSFGINRF